MNSQHSEPCQKSREKSKNSKSTCDFKVKSSLGSLIEDFPSFPRREALRKSLSKERWRLGPRQVGVVSDDIEDEMMDSFQELRPENTFVYCGPHRRAATYSHVKDFNDSASSSITMGSFVDSCVSKFESIDFLHDSISKESSEKGKLVGITTSMGNRRPCLGDELRSKFSSSTSRNKLGSFTSQDTAADSFASGFTGLTSFLTGVDDEMYDSSTTTTSDALLAIKAGFMGVNDSCSLNIARGVPLNRQLREQEQKERSQIVTDDESNTTSKAEAMLRLIQGRKRTGKRRGYNG